jgi:MFS family permease
MRPLIDLWRNERGARPFFVALAQGALGTGAGYVAVMLVAYERLGSAWAASLILLADLLPSMLLGPLIGAWLDRQDRLRCAIIADVLRAAALAGMFVFGGAVPLLAFAVLMGVGNTVFRPAAFALLASVVSAPRRMVATAAWGAIFDGGTMLGPALAAGALVLGGTTALLAANAILFLGSAVLLTRVRLASVPERDEQTGDSLVESTRAGLRFVRSDRVLRLLVGGTGVIVLAAGMMNVAEVVLAQHDLRVGGTGFAALVGVFGIGAVLGSLVSAHSTTLGRLKLGYVGGLGILGLGLLGSSLATSLPLALITFFVTGLGNATTMTHDRGLLQQLVPARMLSRTHALYGTIEAWGLAGAAALGGTLATVLGARGVFAVSGVALLLVTAVAARTLLRREPVPHRLPAPAPV